MIPHPARRLVLLADGQLAPAERQAVETHLTTCARCRTELDEIRSTATLVRGLALVAAPTSVWPAIDRAIDEPAGERAPRTARWPALRWAPAMVAVLAIAAGIVWYSRERAVWDVQVAGAPARMAAGAWIETTPSGARITVGTIGTVDVEPGSRVRLGAARADEYRIELARGAISAEIVAPPRLFFVDTPTSTVVDLGCAYTMRVDDGGAGELRVTSGWASLEWNGRESLVPAGARGRTRPGADPGTPFFDDSTPRLQQAVDDFDFAAGGAAAVGIILAEARVRDTLTLWHLLSRVAPAQRGSVFDRIAALTPPPADVSRDRALALDPATLKRWREELAWTW